MLNWSVSRAPSNQAQTQRQQKVEQGLHPRMPTAQPKPGDRGHHHQQHPEERATLGRPEHPPLPEDDEVDQHHRNHGGSHVHSPKHELSLVSLRRRRTPRAGGPAALDLFRT